MNQIVALALLMSPASEPTVASTLTNIVTVSLDDLGVFEVLSSKDLRRVVELEAERQAMGCSEDSCLAEVAGAMGARLVVFGELGQLGETWVLTLSAFDAERARSAGREILQNEDIGDLGRDVPKAVDRLTRDVRPETGAVTEAPPRVLVLDIQGGGQPVPGVEREGTPEPAPPETTGPSALLLTTGGVFAAVGVGLTGLGVVFGLDAAALHAEAEEAEVQLDRVSAIGARDEVAGVATLFLIGGGAALALGGGILAVALMPSGE